MSSSKLVALMIAFALAAATLQPSEARIQGLKPDCADQDAAAPSSPGSPPVSVPSPPAQPTECLTPLMGMMTCMGYLTNITVMTPPTDCCDGLKSVIKDAPICLCHGMNGDMNSLMPRPIDPIRMLMLPLACGALPPLEAIFSCNTQQVPPIMPPSTPVSPPPSS
ncbi:hypothetical protein ACP4OV_031550 [Aristida adscensionis]